MMVEKVEDKKDLWVIYEVCAGRTMNEHLFDVKGEFYKGERIYMVHHSHFYHALRTNLELLKDFLYRMCIALSCFARLSIVHGDLKPDNIIIDYEPETQSIRTLKVIDLGLKLHAFRRGHASATVVTTSRSQADIWVRPQLRPLFRSLFLLNLLHNVPRSGHVEVIVHRPRV